MEIQTAQEAYKDTRSHIDSWSSGIASIYQDYLNSDQFEEDLDIAKSSMKFDTRYSDDLPPYADNWLRIETKRKILDSPEVAELKSKGYKVYVITRNYKETDRFDKNVINDTVEMTLIVSWENALDNEEENEC